MERQTSAAANDTLQVLYDLSQLLNTGLSLQQLRACVELVENGINAEAVARRSRQKSKSTVNEPQTRDKPNHESICSLDLFKSHVNAFRDLATLFTHHIFSDSWLHLLNHCDKASIAFIVSSAREHPRPGHRSR
ncbi:hypothetical protein BCV70DRAFT_11846 [Testicularia cyperi]|uniref:Mitotic-spindle organizing protein 1 n=1 Tax=Testicularia cyperi TaxID=1882483 RepID=A0A317Y0F3_9BASI|nr:hypothetical protein BCV70DRAFT_11846 [Testicularia cyperi]